MSLGKIVHEQHEKMRNGIEHIKVSKSADGKHFIAEHHYHEYSHPKNGGEYVLKSKHEMAAHLEKHLGSTKSVSDGDKDEE